MQTTLAVVRALERGQAQQDLLSFAVGKAESLPDDRLILSRSLEELWRLVLSDSDDGILSTLSRKFERMNPKTRTWYDTNQANLSHLKEELNGLMDTTVGTLVQIISKKGWARQKLLQK
ncbi:hypothetical protein PR002_g9398 [Phytophthora rubi]|uniref:Uncharacterized protein n=1 Tax=Phytophthora rubi TaxID=129364 RepID=A0A6A3MKR1_9STRA|nr:hypothetical protein PR002_g9398 [Phytophthora rubi]